MGDDRWPDRRDRAIGDGEGLQPNVDIGILDAGVDPGQGEGGRGQRRHGRRGIVADVVGRGHELGAIFFELIPVHRERLAEHPRGRVGLVANGPGDHHRGGGQDRNDGIVFDIAGGRIDGDFAPKLLHGVADGRKQLGMDVAGASPYLDDAGGRHQGGRHICGVGLREADRERRAQLGRRGRQA